MTTTRDGDGPAGEYDSVSAAERDLGVLLGILSDVSALLRQLEETTRLVKRDSGVGRVAYLDEELAVAQQLAEDVNQLRKTAQVLWRRGQGQELDLAVSATAQMAMIRADANDARKRFSGNRLWAVIWGKVKRAAPRLWNLICHLLHVKEWCVSGQIGTPVLGLAQAGISVTFGPSEPKPTARPRSST